MHLAAVAPPQDASGPWDLDAEFEQLFRPPDAEPPTPVPPEPPVPPRPPAPRLDRRRRRPRLIRLRWSTVLGIGIASVTSSVVVTVSVLGAMVSYGPLRQLAFPTARGLSGSWPLLVYGPWFVGCLSILHAAAHRRRARTAWAAVIVFSGIATGLCVSHAPRTATAFAAAGLPPLSALVSFHLLLRQITLLHPRHAKLPRQRKH